MSGGVFFTSKTPDHTATPRVVIYPAHVAGLYEVDEETTRIVTTGNLGTFTVAGGIALVAGRLEGTR